MSPYSLHINDYSPDIAFCISDCSDYCSDNKNWTVKLLLARKAAAAADNDVNDDE